MSTYGCDNDEDCRENDFFLQSKPGGGAGKRRKGRRVPVAAAPAWWHLVKIFDDPQNLLTKKPAARVLCECADDFDHEVVYSLTKKKRWAEVDAATLLNGAHKELAESRVVELTSIAPAYHHKSYERRVVALHELDQDGSVITRKAKGAGRVSSLSSSARKGDPRPAKEKKSNEVVADDVKQKKPIVYYAITQGKPSSYRYFMRWRPSPMARSRRMKCVEDSEPSSSETDGDENVELDEFQHIHDRRLCLGDFISNQKQTYPVERRRIRNSRSSAPKAESLECLELEVKKPFQLIDISVISRVPSTFIHVDFNLDCWTNFNFIEQNVFTVCWLDVHYHRALVDVTRVLPWSMNTGEMLTVMVLERYWKGNEPFLRLHLNTTTVSPKGDFDEQAFKTYMNRCHLSDVRDLIGATIRLLEKWRKQTIPPVDGKEQLIQKKEYLPMFNAAGFPLAQRLTMDYMVRILREETQRQHDQSSDAFDIITLKELEDALENSFPETLTSALSGAKCRSCGTDNVTELYEMEDFWNCRSCLKHFALRQIRSKFFPINIPLVVPEGVSSYDVLPSILPLPLFNFYTKLAATELITNASNGSIQLTDCPGCSQSVDISTQNEYSFVNCECGIVWCTKCKAEPHWPMPCEMAWQWRKQFEAYILGKGRPQRLRQIRCMCCGPPFTFYDHKRRVTCKTCNTTFDPQTMVVISRKGVVCRRRRTYFTLSDRFLPFTGIPPITRPIKRDIVEICLAARNYRFEIAKLNDLGRASGRLNESVPTLKSLRDMRQLFLYIIEYGTAWMYMEQSGPHGTSIRRTLIRLFLLYEKLTAANQYPRLKSEESVENFILRVLNTVDNIKKSL